MPALDRLAHKTHSSVSPFEHQPSDFSCVYARFKRKDYERQPIRASAFGLILCPILTYSSKVTSVSLFEHQLSESYCVHSNVKLTGYKRQLIRASAFSVVLCAFPQRSSQTRSVSPFGHQLSDSYHVQCKSCLRSHRKPKDYKCQPSFRTQIVLIPTEN